MFDLSSSKLLLLGIVALLVVGPKDLPSLLRTLGKYIGMVKRQAAEFRSQFDDAMRDAELQQLKKDVETLGSETEKAVRDGEQSFHKEVESSKSDLDQSIAGPTATAASGTEPTSASADVATAEPPADVTPRSPAEVAAEAAAPKSGA